MSTQVNRRRGTTAQHAVFTGAVGETTYDTDLKRLVAHDGVLAGGYPAAMLHLAQTFAQTQTFAAATNFLGSTATNDNALKFVNPPGVGTSTFDFNTNGTPDLNFFRKYNTTPFQIEMAASGSMDFVIDSNNNETGATVRFLTNAIRGGVQTLLFTVFDNTNATLVGNFTANKLLLPNTTSATVGGIYFGGNRAFHNFGTGNTAAGVNAGNFTMTGLFNSFFGVTAGVATTTGASNAFFGTYAGVANTTGSLNSFFGRSAGQANTTGLRNAFFGRSAGLTNTTASDNSFFGTYSGLGNTTGTYNAFFGRSAGQANTTGFNNSFFGFMSGSANTTGSYNSFFGRAAGQANSTGSYNSFFGFGAGFANTTASASTFFGFDAGFANTTGASNSFFGRGAGFANTTGANNSFFGRNAGFVSTTGDNNTLFGFQAGNNLTTGSNNLVMGYDIDSPTATNSNTLTIGNLIFGTGVDGTGTTISSGLVGIKVINPVTELHVVSTSASDPRGIMSAQHSGDAVGARIHLRKSRGTATAPTTVATGDVLGRLRFSGYDGTNYLQMGSIDVTSVGTIAATRVPTFMAFSTATNVAPSVLTEGFRLTELQTLLMATGKALAMASGANQRAGNAVLVGGTVTVANTTVTANTIVMLTRKTSGGTIGTAITYTTIAATSFTINSDSVIDTSTFSYLLIEVP